MAMYKTLNFNKYGDIEATLHVSLDSESGSDLERRRKRLKKELQKWNDFCYFNSNSYKKNADYDAWLVKEAQHSRIILFDKVVHPIIAKIMKPVPLYGTSKYINKNPFILADKKRLKPAWNIYSVWIHSMFGLNSNFKEYEMPQFEYNGEYQLSIINDNGFNNINLIYRLNETAFIVYSKKQNKQIVVEVDKLRFMIHHEELFVHFIKLGLSNYAKMYIITLLHKYMNLPKEIGKLVINYI